MLKVCNTPLYVATALVYGGTDSGSAANGDIFCVAAVGEEVNVQYGDPPTKTPKDKLGNRNTFHKHIDGSVYLPIQIDDQVSENSLGKYHHGKGSVYGVTVRYTGCREAYHIGSVSTSFRRNNSIYQGVRVSIHGSLSGVTFKLAVNSCHSINRKCIFKGVPETVTLQPGWAKTKFVTLYRTGTADWCDVTRRVQFELRVFRVPKPEDFSRATGAIDTLFKYRPFFVSYEHALAHDWAAANGIPDAVTQAVESMRLVSVNTLAYLSDLTGLVSQYRSFKRDLMRAKRGNKKAIANLYLSWTYGIRLFVSDTQSFIRAYRDLAKKAPRNTFRAKSTSTQEFGNSTITTVSTATVYVQNMTDAELSFYRATRSVDLFPSAANVWDFIPFSFVVDWCIDVGGHLEKLDASLDILLYPVLGAELSIKSTSRLVARPPLSTDADFVRYRRWSESQKSLSRLPLSSLPGVGEGLSLKHGLDSLMLLVQRFSR